MRAMNVDMGRCRGPPVGTAGLINGIALTAALMVILLTSSPATTGSETPCTETMEPSCAYQDTENTVHLSRADDPVLTITEPQNGSTINDARPRITVIIEGGTFIGNDVSLDLDGKPVLPDQIEEGRVSAVAPRTLSEGEHTLTATFTQNDGPGAVAVAAFSVVIKPTAIPSASTTTAIIYQSVTLDATASYSSEGRDIVEYWWDVDNLRDSDNADGDGLNSTGACDDMDRKGDVIEHRFDRVGTYRVTLWVSDGTGKASASVTIKIFEDPDQDHPPTVHASYGWSGIDLTVRFYSPDTYDPEGGALSYEWDFGDGSNSSLPEPVHVYESREEYTVELVVSDGANENSTTMTVDLGNADELPAPQRFVPQERPVALLYVSIIMVVVVVVLVAFVYHVSTRRIIDQDGKGQKSGSGSTRGPGELLSSSGPETETERQTDRMRHEMDRDSRRMKNAMQRLRNEDGRGRGSDRGGAGGRGAMGRGSDRGGAGGGRRGPPPRRNKDDDMASELAKLGIK